MFLLKKLTGKFMVPDINAFKELGMKLEEALSTKDIFTLRRTICEVLYTASLKLVCIKGAKLLTDADRNSIENISDSNDNLECL